MKRPIHVADTTGTKKLIVLFVIFLVCLETNGVEKIKLIKGKKHPPSLFPVIPYFKTFQILFYFSIKINT
jgi:hypothetical protein